MVELFEGVVEPVATMFTRGAWLRRWRLLAIDGFDVDVPDTPANAGEFGYAGSGKTVRPTPRCGWWRCPSAAPTRSWPPRSTRTRSGRRPWPTGCTRA